MTDAGAVDGALAPTPATAGFCPSPHLSAGAALAFAALRTAAIDPARISDRTVSIDRLINGTSAGGPDGLSRRLAVLRDDPTYATTGPGADTAPFFRRAGFTTSDLLEARTYMAQEIQAFERGFQTLPAVRLPDGTDTDHFPLPGGGFTSMIRYAATGTDPIVPGAEYYAARARWHDEHTTYSTTAAGPNYFYNPPLSSGRVTTTMGSPYPSEATLFEKSTRAAGDLLEIQRGSGVTRTLTPGAERVLTQFIGDARDAMPGLVYACYNTAGGTGHMAMRVYGSDMANTLTIVRGKDGLSCATQGNVEGQPCLPSTYVITPTFTADEDVATVNQLAPSGFTHAAHIEFNDNALAVGPPSGALPPLYFIVKPALPGSRAQYVSVLGFAVDVPIAIAVGGGTPLFCNAYPISSTIEDGTRDAIAPAASYCAFPSQTCAGIPYDQRLPLEDELTADSDPVESSWRHYLDIADTAAQQSDSLGDQLVQAGLELDIRAETAVEELSRVCGATVNVNGLVDAMGGGASTGPCNAMGGCDNTNYVCQDGTCVIDLVKVAISQAASEPDANRLATCLGRSSQLGGAALGTTTLYYWVGPHGTLCEDTPAGTLCPSPTPVTAPHPPLLTAVPLRIFIPDDPGATMMMPTGAGSHIAPPCDSIAALRSGMAMTTAARQALVSDIKSHREFWDTAHLREVAQRISWSAYPGDFSAVLLDRGPWIWTGLASSGPPPGYPCTVDAMRPPPVACPTTPYTTPGTEGSIFCANSMCGAPFGMGGGDAVSRVTRARFNDRLARAVYAARITTGAGMAGTNAVLIPRLDVDEFASFLGADGEADTARDDGVHHVFTNSGGTIRLDDGGHTVDLLTKLTGARYYYVTGPETAPAGTACSGVSDKAEWALCPYDRSQCSEVFSSVTPGGATSGAEAGNDCDDAATPARWQWDYNMPMIVHQFPANINVASSASVAATLYAMGGLSAGTGVSVVGSTGGFRPVYSILLDDLGMDGTVTRPSDVWLGPAATRGSDLGTLTRYWERLGCGQGHDFTHGFPDNLRDPDTCNVSTGLGCDDNLSTACFRQVGADDHSVNILSDADANHSHLEYWDTFDGNRAFIAPNGFTATNLLDAAELMCAVDAIASPVGGLPDSPPEIHTVSDLNRASAWMQREADKIIQANQNVILTDVPDAAVQALLGVGATGSNPSLSGEFGTQVGDLRAALIDLSDSQRSIAQDVQTLATQIKNVREVLRQITDETVIATLNLQSTIMNEITACVKAVTDAVSADPASSAAKSAGAGFTCANSGAQLQIASEILGVRSDALSSQQTQQLNTAQGELDTAYSDLQGQGTRIRSSVERIKAALSAIATTQRAGRRALAKALMLDSDASGAEYAVNTVMRRRLNTLNTRYQAAFRNAVRSSYIAKLAIEQRLGMRMETMTAPMTLLDEPPARWHMDVCSMTGINYDAIRSTAMDGGTPPDMSMGPTPDGGRTTSADNFAGEYVGDYVRKLRQVVESYSFDYPFEAGSDTSVLSLRDEILGDRRECEVTAPNFVLESGHFDVLTAPGGAPGWTRVGCIPAPIPAPSDTIGDAGPPVDSGLPRPPPWPSCVRVDDLASLGFTDSTPIGVGMADLGRVQGFRVRFGDPGTGGITTQGAITAGVRLAQNVDVPEGVYRMSWFEQHPSGGLPGPAEGGALEVRVAYDGTHFVDLLDATARSSETIVGTAWVRHFAFFQLRVSGTVEVAVVPGYMGFVDGPRDVFIAAPMLEATRLAILPGTAADADLHSPAAYVDTGATRTSFIRACEDTDGDEFRRTGWTRNCLRLCPDGYGAMCDDTAASTRCFWETKFAVTQRAIERGDLIHAGGFAYGNFNYRFDSIALNFVGTNVHDCSTSASPSTCYASGTVPYSITHLGPYTVRNHRGEDYDAPLFTGVIETARGLAAERYITNPISSADQTLIDPYLRHEFSGRPLDGSYVLRVWDDGAVNFDAIQDIQIVLNYRYWTRFH